MEELKVRTMVVIEAERKRGCGTEEDPVRTIAQYWDLDGNLLAEYDPRDDRLPLKVRNKKGESLRCV